VLLPHLKASSQASVQPGSRTVTAALVQRTRILQEENDELYDILKRDETGKLKEEVRGLRRVVERLETALRGMFIYSSTTKLLTSDIIESHQVIQTLS
jgi:hypothetical protein